MDFLAVGAFLLLFYIRPQEWIGGLESFHPVMIVFIVGIVAMVFRSKGFSPRGLVKTPHDWLMAAFLIWIAMASAGAERGFSNIPGLLLGTLIGLWGLKNLAGFYYVVSQALYSRRRLEKFIWVWLGMILLLALLAVASEFGIDLMDSYDRTHVKMQGRLILNNGLFDNPNALGHGVISIIPLIYLFCVWKRPAAIKQGALMVLVIPLYCVYLTKSKGAYLSGAFTGLVGVVFGRPKIVKILLLGAALTGGVVMIKMLPRMSDLRDPRSEEGIQGRLLAFNYGYHCLRNNTILGQGNFVQSFQRVYSFPKASHSGYNQVGAELGLVGFFLYLAIFYCALKTLITSKTRNIPEERLRRVLMAAVAGFMASCWMIDLAYHGTFFFIMAAVAAFHRLMLEPAEGDEGVGDIAPEEVVVDKSQDDALAEGSAGGGKLEDPQSDQDASETKDESDIVEENRGIKWTRYGWVDLVWCSLIFMAAIRFWKYIVFSWGK
jgi:hypothetical protein